jgi:hypothetical protein
MDTVKPGDIVVKTFKRKVFPAVQDVSKRGFLSTLLSSETEVLESERDLLSRVNTFKGSKFEIINIESLYDIYIYQEDGGRADRELVGYKVFFRGK